MTHPAHEETIEVDEVLKQACLIVKICIKDALCLLGIIMYVCRAITGRGLRCCSVLQQEFDQAIFPDIVRVEKEDLFAGSDIKASVPGT